MIDNLINYIALLFAWNYENRRASYLQKLTIPSYPEDVIQILTNPNNMNILGLTNEEIKLINNATSTTIDTTISKVYLDVFKRIGFDLNESIDPSGSVIIPSLSFENGETNVVAMMKYFRYIRWKNVIRKYQIKDGLLNSKAPYNELSRDFLVRAFNKDFLTSLGMREDYIYNVFSIKSSFTNNKDKNMKLVMKTLNNYIGGWISHQKNKTSIDGVYSATWINGEFRKRSTQNDIFIEEFKRENSIRAKTKQNGRWPAFSENLISKCLNGDFLVQLGVPEEYKSKILSSNYNPANPNDFSKRSISIVIAKGIMNSDAYKGKKATPQRKELDYTSGIKAVYKEICTESQESFANHRYGKDEWAMTYSTSLINTIFETPIVDLIRSNLQYSRSIEDIVYEWLGSLSEEGVLAQLGFTSSRLMYAYTLKKEDRGLDRSAANIACSFDMLARTGYTSNGSVSIWENLSESQRKMFRMSINVDIKKAFIPYKEAHPDLFPVPTNTYFQSCKITS